MCLLFSKREKNLRMATTFRTGMMQMMRLAEPDEDGAYKTEVIDSNTGCANLMHFVNKDGKDVLVATNREIDEAAMYTVTA